MKKNFVLLELCLLAVAAIALTAFAVPALTRLRAAAEEAGCMANLDRNMKGFASYAADNDGWIFSNLPGKKTSSERRAWGEVLYRGKRIPLKALNCPTLPVAPAEFIHTYGMFRTALEAGNHFYKARLRRWGDFAHPGKFALYYQTKEMKSPGEVMILADTEIYDGKKKGYGFFAFHPVVPAFGSAVSMRHSDSVNLSFADGHAAPQNAAALAGRGFCRWVDDGSLISR